MKGAPKNNLSQLGNIAGYGAAATGAAVGLGVRGLGSLDPKIQAKTGAEVLRSPVGEWAADELTKLGPDDWRNQWASQVLGQLTEGGVEYAKNLKGLQGIVGDIQANKLTKRIESGDLTGARKLYLDL